MSRRARRALCIIAVVTCFLAVRSPAWSAESHDPGTPVTRSFFDDDSVSVRMDRPTPGVAMVSGAGPGPVAEFRRSPAVLCGIDNELRTHAQVVIDCSASDINRSLPAAECTPDQRAIDPLFRRSQSPTGVWSEWTVAEGASCVPDINIRSAVATEFQRLPLTPSPLSVQPPSGWTLVNVDTVVYTDDGDQVLPTTLLGVGVTIRATPARFTWNFGDGSAEVVTTDPGRPWPEQTIAHRYMAEATHTIQLTTSWSGEFQVAGTTTWEPVEGTATTTTTSSPLTVYEARSHLVAGTID